MLRARVTLGRWHLQRCDHCSPCSGTNFGLVCPQHVLRTTPEQDILVQRLCMGQMSIAPSLIW